MSLYHLKCKFASEAPKISHQWHKNRVVNIVISRYGRLGTHTGSNKIFRFLGFLFHPPRSHTKLLFVRIGFG
ncbi:hypothetical protein YC2023_108964 [Brassica napus]